MVFHICSEFHLHGTLGMARLQIEAHGEPMESLLEALWGVDGFTWTHQGISSLSQLPRPNHVQVDKGKYSLRTKQKNKCTILTPQIRNPPPPKNQWSPSLYDTLGPSGHDNGRVRSRSPSQVQAPRLFLGFLARLGIDRVHTGGRPYVPQF